MFTSFFILIKNMSVSVLYDTGKPQSLKSEDIFQFLSISEKMDYLIVT